MVADNYQAPRTGRIQVKATENQYLLHKHALTLIGRVTNPSVQKVWALLAFFADHWKTERKPVGADLGQGMFQFQFELESDLLSVLGKRPYHYAHWMVILQRWEPTTSPQFPSLIPFWIKIQGIPVHLRTEDTIRRLGEDIGTYEEADITSLAVRMRVHVNGRLPLIKKSIIEYEGGDEVIAHFVYERLEKHCLVCHRLDHDVKNCLEAKARKREALKAKEDAVQQRDPPKFSVANREATPRSGNNQSSDNKQAETREEGYRARRDDYYQSNRDLPSRRSNPSREHYHPYKRPSRSQSDDRGSYHYSSHAQRQRQNQYQPRVSSSREFIYRPVSRNHSEQQEKLPPKPGKNGDDHNREGRKPLSPRDRDSEHVTHSKSDFNSPARGVPLRESPVPVPRQAFEKALEDVREYMVQYTNCADPAESAERRDRFRRAEELGEVEETAISMAKASLAIPPESPRQEATPQSLERVPIAMRLGPLHAQDNGDTAELQLSSQSKRKQNLQIGEPSLTSPGRIPAVLRLGPQDDPERESAELSKSKAKRKPGRPPAKPKTQTRVKASPLKLIGSTSRKRKTTLTKAPTTRQKTGAPAPQSTKAGTNSKSRKGSPGSSSTLNGSKQNSDNQPLARMIPPKSKRKMDFPNPSILGP